MAIRKINSIASTMPELDGKNTIIEVEPQLAQALKEDELATDNYNNVMSALEDTAENAVPEVFKKVEAEEPVKTKLTLDESIEDFAIEKSSKRNVEDESDRYTDYDMFDFIYSLFSSETDSLIRPLKALSNEKKKKNNNSPAFMYQGSDDYIDELGEQGLQGVGQVSTDRDGNVVLYQDEISNFDKVIDICDEYEFEYSGPEAKRAPWVRWNFSFTITVPTTASGYPMEVEDYFEKIGIPIEEVMPAEFIKGRSKGYKKFNDEVSVKVIFDKYVKKAALSNDPLEGFIKDMFKELSASGVKFDRNVLKASFLDKFNDDFEDEE